MVDDVTSGEMFESENEIDSEVKKWTLEIEKAEEHEETRDWLLRGSRIVQRYKNREDGHNYSYNVLWSNVQTLQPAIYSRTPKVVARRRHPDKDQLGRAAATILENSTHFQIEEQDFDHVMKRCRDDYLLPGRGQAWVRYEPIFGSKKTYIQNPGEAPDGVELAQDDSGLYFEEGDILLSERAVVDYVYWKDFLHNPTRCWEEVRWVAKRVYMTLDELKAHFGEERNDGQPAIAEAELKKVLENVERKPDDGEYEEEPGKELFKKGVIFEIWDKEKKEVLWVSKKFKDKPLKKLDDPLGLEEFFPCPRPLLATTTSESLVPSPDFSIYQNLAEELESLTKRIEQLEDQIRISGAYNPECGELARLLDEGAENMLVPARDWVSFSQSGGFKGALDFLPLDEPAKALLALYQARDRLKNDMYEITGLSDLLRGSSNPGDTATAQQIKGRFADLRLTDRQQEMQRFARDVIRIIAEIVAEHFSHDTVMSMSGAEFQVSDEVFVNFNEAMKLLEDDTLRGYRLDIETDSTLAVDEEMEREGRINFLNAVGQFMQQLAGVDQMGPEFMPVFNEVLMFGLKGFRAGRPLERTMEDALQKAAQARLEASKQPPPPDPKEKELQFKQQESQAKMQFETQKFQAEQQAKFQEMQGEFALQREKIQGDLAIQEKKVAGELHIGFQKLELMMQELQADLLKIRGELELKEMDIAGDFAIEKLKVAAQADNDARDIIKDQFKHEKEMQKESGEKESSNGSSGSSAPQVVIAPLQSAASEKVIEVLRGEDGMISGAKVTEDGSGRKE